MNEREFLACASGNVLSERPALLGCPLDMTSTYREGTGGAPREIRRASDSLETYSPFLDRDLEDSPFSDIGDIDFANDTLEKALDRIERTVFTILGQGGRPLCLGGEHTITLPVVRALNATGKDFAVLHLDAHSDLRQSYENSAVNHATVIRRVVDLIGPKRLIQLGIRAGTREEFSWMRQNGTLLSWGPDGEKTLLERIGDSPVYLTLDLDVLDPSCLPATGNPEAGGWFYGELERLFRTLRSVSIVGADVVELNPLLDPSEVATITAAKIVREILLIF